MNREQLREWSEFVAVLAREKPEWSAGEVAEAAVRLRAVARARQIANERRCNDEGWTDADDQRTDNRVAKTLGAVGLGAVLQGDPRGAAVKLVLPSGRTNDWGQEGYCVPTA